MRLPAPSAGASRRIERALFTQNRKRLADEDPDIGHYRGGRIGAGEGYPWVIIAN
jgi:hypothetical protein